MINSLDSFGDNLNIVVFGGAGGIGGAFIDLLLTEEKVSFLHAVSRKPISTNHPKLIKHIIDITNEEMIETTAADLSAEQPIDIVIVATGILHDNGNLQPEKSLRDISTSSFEKVFSINTIGPALVMKHFLPKLNRERKSVFAALSARVGSISDNQLGGWHAYRASKAALNMLIKNASIEIGRRNKQACIVGLHPGTVDTNLSEPFKNNVAEGKLFTPEFSAKSLLSVINNLSVKNTGDVIAWDGEKIPS